MNPFEKFPFEKHIRDNFETEKRILGQTEGPPGPGPLYYQEELLAEWRVLQACWHATQTEWRDRVAKGFEREFLRPLEKEMPLFLKASGDFEEILQMAIRRCT